MDYPNESTEFLQIEQRRNAIKVSELSRGQSFSRKELSEALNRICDASVETGVTKREIQAVVPQSVQTRRQLEQWEKAVKNIVYGNEIYCRPYEPALNGSKKGYYKAKTENSIKIKEKLLNEIRAVH